MTDKRYSTCRICSSLCPIAVTVEDGRAVKVEGDFEAPLYDGYTCPKGRALPQQHNGPSRLLHSQKRGPDGRFTPVDSSQMLDEIAERLSGIIDRHGPESVALYYGTALVSFAPMTNIAHGFMEAIGSRMIFNPGTIDKPGAYIAQAAHGTWQAGHPPFEDAECWILIGLNPVISKSGGFPHNNPALRLKEATARGMKLVVIDPRVIESAQRAYIHLQIRPGTDPAVLAAMLNVILAEGLHDADFITDNVDGLGALRAAIAPFTPDVAARIADVPAADIIEAARVFARSRYAGIGSGVGASFAINGPLTDYLICCLMTVCGFYAREGERAAKPHVLLPAYEPKAQASGPVPYRGIGKAMRVRGLSKSAAGMPTAALAEEMLLEGEGRVRALINLAGNPLAAWPDQKRTYDGLRSLELLVTTAYEMTGTAELSHYVAAPKLTLEIPSDSTMLEAMRFLGPLRGVEGPYARYAPAVVDPPPGSDLIEDWELFWGLAERMGLDLSLTAGYGMFGACPPWKVALDMSRKPTADDLLEIMASHARVPLAEVKQHPHGAMFDVEVRVGPRDPGHEARLDVGNQEVLARLDEFTRPLTRTTDAEHPFTLVSRRINNIMNSCGLSIDALRGRRRYNPAFLHPDDLAALGAEEGDLLRVVSPYGEITAVAGVDKGLRRGLVSMTHCYGGMPGAIDDPREAGANVNQLTDTAADFDPITGMPRMGALAVRVEVVHAPPPTNRKAYHGPAVEVVARAPGAAAGSA